MRVPLDGIDRLPTLPKRQTPVREHNYALDVLTLSITTTESRSRAGVSHAIQACYLGPRGRLVVRSNGDRVGPDGADAAGRLRPRQCRFQNGSRQNEIEQYETRRDHRNGAAGNETRQRR